jgi:small subunit ribosomal protein S13
MIYLLESTIPEEKSVFFALRYIYGVGGKNSFLVCKKLGFSVNLKIKDLSKEQVNKLIKTLESLDIELSSELKKIKSLKKKTLISIKAYRGLRSNRGLPVRGQRTHTNAKTARKRN